MGIYSLTLITDEFRARFKPTRLYIKELAGVKYFGKTVKKNVHSYNGSGKIWKDRIKKYGADNIKTLWVSDWYYDADELQSVAIHFSQENQIVESDGWANCKPENGLDGGHCGELGAAKIKMSKRGSVPWNKGLVGVVKSNPESNRIRAEKNRGKKRSQEFKDKMRKINTGRERTPEQKAHQRAIRKGIPLSPEHNRNKALAQTGLKRKIVKCPYCGMEGGKNGMTRYHFDNCPAK